MIVCPFCLVVSHVSVEKLGGADVKVLVTRETLIELVDDVGH